MAPKNLTRKDIEQLIDAGDTIVLYRRDVLRLNAWLKRHPGGGKCEKQGVNYAC